MDRATLIRSHVLPTWAHSALAASISLAHRLRAAADGGRAAHRRVDRQVLGPRNPAIPAFIDIGQRLEGNGEKEELKAFHTAGFLGTEFGPFTLPFPDQAIDAVRPPKGMTPERFRQRYRRYQELVKQSPLGEYGSDYQQESMLRSMDNAHRLLSSPEPRRSICRSSRRTATTNTTPAGSAWAACSPGG